MLGNLNAFNSQCIRAVEDKANNKMFLLIKHLLMNLWLIAEPQWNSFAEEM